MKILILNGYSDSNKGDLAITEATVSALKEVHSPSSITIHSVFPEKDPDFSYHNRFMHENGVEIREMVVPSPYIKQDTTIVDNFLALYRLFASYFCLLLYRVGLGSLVRRLSVRKYNSLQDFFSADLVYMKGGQFIYNDQGGLRGLLYLFRMLTPLYLRKNITILGQSIGPIKGRVGSWLTKSALARAKKIYSREEDTYRYLTNSLKLNNVDKIPDLAFFYSLSREDLLDKGEGKVGITVVNWSFPESNKKEEHLANYKSSMVSAINHLIGEYGYRVDLVPQVTVKHHGHSDMDLINEIYREVGSENLNIVTGDLSPKEMVRLYAGYEFVIGTRLHSCILALCAGTPVIAIKYQGYKTDGVMNEVGLKNYVLDIYALERQSIIEKIVLLMKERTVLNKRIEENVHCMAKVIMEKVRSA